MSNRSSKQSPQNSSAPTVQNQFQPRSLAIQAQTEATPTSETEKPDLQAEAERAKNFGHNIANISFAPRSTFAPDPIQPKLTIGQPGDQYEQEADRVANEVVSKINAPPLQRRVSGESGPSPDTQVRNQLNLRPLQRRVLGENVQQQEAAELQMKPISRLIQRREASEGEEEVQMKPACKLRQHHQQLCWRECDRKWLSCWRPGWGKPNQQWSWQHHQ